MKLLNNAEFFSGVFLFSGSWGLIACSLLFIFVHAFCSATFVAELCFHHCVDIFYHATHVQSELLYPNNFFCDIVWVTSFSPLPICFLISSTVQGLDISYSITALVTAGEPERKSEHSLCCAPSLEEYVESISFSYSVHFVNI